VPKVEGEHEGVTEKSPSPQASPEPKASPIPVKHPSSAGVRASPAAVAVVMGAVLWCLAMHGHRGN
jgi:hypothetical protein